jgi:cation channel sperm-associated protein 3
MLIIIANVITIALETEYHASSPYIGNAAVPDEFEYLNLIYLAVYTLEFILKIYVEPRRYWKSGYDKFDFVILAISYFQWIVTFTNTQAINLTFLRVVRGASL